MLRRDWRGNVGKQVEGISASRRARWWVEEGRQGPGLGRYAGGKTVRARSRAGCGVSCIKDGS